jgi:hypothetical protein
MMNRAAFLLAVLLAGATASAQYSTDFESMSASATGVSLAGQDGFYLPSTSSLDFDVFTYANNSYGIPRNPNGGNNFVAGEAAGSPAFARAQRDISWGPGNSTWSVSYDVLVTAANGTPAGNDYIGSFSPRMQTGSTTSYVHLFSWMPGSSTQWQVTYNAYTAGGSSTASPGLSPGPKWTDLHIDRWYRFTTDLNFVENRITRVTITDLASGGCDETEFTDLYLKGGAVGLPAMPWGFRFFTGGASAGNITAWDNCTISEGPAVLTCDPVQCTWPLLGVGFDNDVEALAVFDDGSGPALYAAGGFTAAGGIPANCVAKWDGVSWSALDGGVDSIVKDMVVFDDGSGPALYVTGGFNTAGGVPANRIARWDGSSWSALAGGVDGAGLALAVFDDGFGTALYVGGAREVSPLEVVGFVDRWDGTVWTQVGNIEDGQVNAIATIAIPGLGSATSLIAGGSFRVADGRTVNRIARWDGRGWWPLGEGVSSVVVDLAANDSGSGPPLYVGGHFTTAGGVDAARIAGWDGLDWTPLGEGLDDAVRSLLVFDDGSGSAVYAGGDFMLAGGFTAPHIAKWDGASWSGLGEGAGWSVSSAVGFDDGRGARVHINVNWGRNFPARNDTVVRLECEGIICYADCDQSTGNGVLDIFDYLCFQNSFVSSEPYACDCDTSTGNGVCDVFDFLCFQDAFVGGCP